MKKKIFFQISILLYIILALFLAIMGVAVYGMIEFFNSILNNANTADWIGLIAVAGGFLFVAYLFIKGVRNTIILTEIEIFVPEHWGNKDNKLQYETHIPYDEIQDIYIITSNKNSLGKTARWIFIPMPYIVFECKEDKQKAINVYYYSKKQVVRIIDEAILRAKLSGNELQLKTGAEILADYMETQRRKKKNG